MYNTLGIVFHAQSVLHHVSVQNEKFEAFFLFL